jgi:hypothetical protein
MNPLLATAAVVVIATVVPAESCTVGVPSVT